MRPPSRQVPYQARDGLEGLLKHPGQDATKGAPLLQQRGTGTQHAATLAPGAVHHKRQRAQQQDVAQHLRAREPRCQSKVDQE